MSHHEIVPADPVYNSDESDDDDDSNNIFYSPPSTHQTEQDYATSSQFTRIRSLTSGREHIPEPFNSERLPPTLASEIQKFLRVANLIEVEEPRVAYICMYACYVVCFMRYVVIMLWWFGVVRSVSRF